MSTFRAVPSEIDFSVNDHQILELWKSRRVFKRSEELHANAGRPYVFYDGPPGTNGRPHIGHIMQSALKDVWPRYKTMRGYTAKRKAGWDTHGLPVELTAEAELHLKSKREIESFGVAKFVDHCRNTVLRFRDDWVAAITRLGRFCDFENDYLTMSNDFIQSDWWVMHRAWEQGLLYKDYKILPYCARCGTGLSSHEVAQGYRDITELTITAKFPLVDDASVSMLAWTTTPWTLLGNTALCVGPEIEYSVVRMASGEGVILASALIEKNAKGLGADFTVEKTVLGRDLIGRPYSPLWPSEHWTQDGRIHEVVADPYVTTEDGTGIVHLALYGEDDFRLIKQGGFKRIQHVGPDGVIGPLGPDAYRGRFFKEPELDVDIVKDLAQRGRLFDKYRNEHSYPHCWRCRTPLMYFAKSSWFIKTTALRDQMLAANAEIRWYPEHIKDGRFGKWLENNVDWAVSRDRYWGSPINIWANVADPDDRRCYSSVAELQKAGAILESTGGAVPDDLDLHIPAIDDVVVPGENGAVYRRETGVLDCWFNAGIMPWGQYGYPAKAGSAEEFAGQYPADFICEAIDQTRGWFYTLLAASTLVTGKSSFRNVICTELILDTNGKKMSKSVGNVIDPLPLVEKFGADAVRWTFYDSDPWQVKRYADDLPREALRAIFIPIWNCYSFFVTYANLDGWDPRKTAPSQQAELDRWILSALRGCEARVVAGLESYDIREVSAAIREFVEGLSNWYIRRSRRRFWKSENDGDKAAAYCTLYEVLVTLSQLIAPLAPFLAETIYQNLVYDLDSTAPDSVHLTSWPNLEHLLREPDLEQEIAVIQEAASLARALRVEHDLKVRQPLGRLLLVPQDPTIAGRLEHHLGTLLEEVNVKAVQLVADSADFVTVTLKPNWPRLGPRYGKLMKPLGAAITALGSDAIRDLRSGKSVPLTVEEQPVTLEPDDVAIVSTAKPGLAAQSGSNATVALSTELTPELIAEGHARELVSVVQRHRKSEGYEISDQIELTVTAPPELKRALERNEELIARECLIKVLSLREGAPSAGIEVNGYLAMIESRKVVA
jgi:isoleucyl-tRNA synthetase